MGIKYIRKKIRIEEYISHWEKVVDLKKIQMLLKFAFFMKCLK